VNQFCISGPDRVVVGPRGESLRPRDTPAHLRPAIIFVRDDGWSLGACKALAQTAREMYEDEWDYAVIVATGREYPLVFQAMHTLLNGN